MDPKLIGTMPPGKLVVIEGSHGMGKSTLAGQLQKHLAKKNFNVHVTTAPFKPAAGQIYSQASVNHVRHHLKDIAFKPWLREQVPRAVPLAFFVDRLVHNYEIEKFIAKGINVISDRYNDTSGYAFQVADGALTEDEYMLLKNMFPCRRPDAVVFLDGNIHACLLRARKLAKTKATEKRGTYEDLGVEFHEKVRERYLKALHPNNNTFVDKVITIDNVHEKDQIEVFTEAMELVAPLLTPKDV